MFVWLGGGGGGEGLSFRIWFWDLGVVLEPYGYKDLVFGFAGCVSGFRM